ncbi:lipocalin family protein [Halioglobus maricola]|uniref:lipocalin family protein n=1 Tax=Halioglobus maricola TaxID=2601894 RepID=UPI001F0FBCD1|nr:lipocalin family protein [Halioglobus maricola]
MSACGGIPEGIEPVSGFDLEKYSGKWYEVARLDHRFERGLEKVTATYLINDDGTVRVENRGFSTSSNEWEDAVGKAKFAGDESVGHLKVSFFGPFYGSYVIFELDKENYRYAFITGGENTLWLLSRTPTVSEQIKERFLNRVGDAGYKTDELIFVNQE